jgi:hypothetical protein
MTDHDWEKFEHYALQLDALHHAMQAAEAITNFALAKTIGFRIKAAESTRDQLLCRIGHSLSVAA